MQLRDGRDQCQTQSVALRGAAGGAAIEAPGYLCQIFGWDPGAIVNDRRDGLTVYDLQGNA